MKPPCGAHRRLLRHILIGAFVIALAGCGNGNNSTSTPTPTSNTVSTVLPTAGAESTSASPNTTASGSSKSSSTPANIGTARVNGVVPFLYPTPGGGSVFDSNADGDLTWDEYKQAVAAAIDVFPWPPSYHITPDIVVAGFAKDPNNLTAQFQVGFELNNIGAFWNCAWFETWLTARQSGDKQLEAQALEYIVNSLPQSVNDDYSRNFLKSIGDKALLGDPSGVIQVYNANRCSQRLQDIRPAGASPAAGG